MQVAEHVQEQLHKVDSTMSKPTAESLFDLYRKLQELYQMKDSLPNRYPALRGEMPKGGIEQLTEDPCILPTHLHHLLHTRQSRLLVSGVRGSITRRVLVHLWVGLV